MSDDVAERTERYRQPVRCASKRTASTSSPKTSGGDYPANSFGPGSAPTSRSSDCPTDPLSWVSASPSPGRSSLVSSALSSVFGSAESSRPPAIVDPRRRWCLSRAAFGVRGNRLPSVISWLLCVGWETALTVIAVLATSTVFTRIGWSGGTATKIVAMLVVAGLIIAGGVMGFELIMRMQAIITVVTGYLDHRLHRAHVQAHQLARREPRAQWIL